MDVIVMFSEFSQIVWVSLSTLIAFFSLAALIPFDQRIAQQTNPRVSRTKVVRMKYMLAGIFILSMILGLFSAPYARLSTPVINHYVSHQPILWGSWWEYVGNAVVEAFLLLFMSQIILRRAFRHAEPIPVIPKMQERLGIIMYDATFEVGLVLYAWLSLLLGITRQLYGSP